MRTLVGLTNSRDVKAFARHLSEVNNKDDYRYVCLNNRMKSVITKTLKVDESFILTEVDLFDSSIHKLENELGIAFSDDEFKLLRTCNRYDAYNYYPFTYAVRSYLYKKTSKHKLINALGFIEKKLENWNVSRFVVSSTDLGLSIYIYLYFVAKHKNISTQFLTFTRVFKQYIISDNPLERLDIKLSNNQDNVDLVLLKDHKKNLEDNISTHKLFYGDMGSLDSNSYKNEFFKKLFQPWRWQHIGKQILSNNFGYSFKLDRIDQLTELFFAFRRWKNSKFYKKVGLNSENLPSRFVYYPLHQEPEVSTLVLGNEFVNQLETIEKLAKKFSKLNLPLVVKDHPAAFGLNRLKRLKAINEIDNVYFASLLIDSLDIIKKAEAVITITGTSAFEARLLGNKSFVLNQCIFSNNTFNITPQLKLNDVFDFNEGMDVSENETDLANYYSYVAKYSFVPIGDDGLLTDEAIGKLMN